MPTSNVANFQEQLNIVFDKIAMTYGNKDEMMKFKVELLDTFENEESRRSAELLKLLKPKHFQIDADGNIKRVG